MATTWVIAADSSSARFFTADTPVAPLVEFDAVLHPEGVAPARELTTDRPGRSFDSFGAGRHAMESEIDPKAQEARTFAKALADRIDSGRARGEVNRLILIAPPAFLGLLRDALPAESRRIVEREIDKHLVKLPTEEIRARLPERLYSALG